MHLRICVDSESPQCDVTQVCAGLYFQLWPDRLYLHLPCFLFSSISIRFSRRFSSLTFFCLRRFLFSRSSGGLEDNQLLRSIKSTIVNSPPEKKKNRSDLRMCPEFPWTESAAAGRAHRCWTRRWAAGEPDNDGGDGPPARSHTGKIS